MIQFNSLQNALGWLANNDPNGLWSEYLAGFFGACAEHGELSLEEANEVIKEQHD